jgi:UDP-N-acetylglucosamine transferase subunit ALG13
MTTPDRPFVLVTTGTDSHPFGRVVRWVDRWVAEHPGVDAVVQHGTAEPPVHATAVPYLPPDELQRLVAGASIVVCHSGTIVSECRRLGVVPVVVPRRRQLGEAVDDHQLRFARRLAQDGGVVCCETEEELRRALSRSLTDEVRHRPSRFTAEPPPGVERAARALDQLLPSSHRVPGAHGDVGRAAGGASRVLFVGGAGRSGTTLLERMLGELPGVQAAGELTHLWQRGVVDDERCSCGAPFSRCAFWQAVGTDAFGGWDGPDVDRLISVRRRVDRTRQISRLAGRSLPPRLAGLVQEYDDGYLRLHDAIRRVSGTQVVVDSSKRASLAFCLNWSDRVDLRVVHMIRDSRAVAHSCSRLVPRPEVTDGGPAFMPRHGALHSALLWNSSNALFALLAARGVPTTVVRYEDLVREPAAVIAHVAAFADVELPASGLSFLGRGRAVLGRGHSVAGNPMRFQAGPVPIREDLSWRSAMPVSARRTVGALTCPAMSRYGYFWPGRRPSGPGATLGHLHVPTPSARVHPRGNDHPTAAVG